MRNGVLDDSKAGANPSGLKLTYSAKDGSFKGSFKAYSVVAGKLKSTTVNVSGEGVRGTCPFYLSFDKCDCCHGAHQRL